MSVSQHTARILIELNRDFYRRVARSFSQTRHSVWPGQAHCAQIIYTNSENRDRSDCTPVRVLDVASGNARFEQLLGQGAPHMQFECVAADVSSGMSDAHLDIPSNVQVTFEQVDFMAPFLDEHGGGDSEIARFSNSCQETAPFDACVCFGFFHHIPIQSWRKQLLACMCEAVSKKAEQTRNASQTGTPNSVTAHSAGVVAISLWRFLDDPKMAARAQKATERAFDLHVGGLSPENLGPNDRFLSWQGKDVFRYCHSFTDEEVSDLASVCPANMKAERFFSDGKSGKLNEYLVFVPRD